MQGGAENIASVNLNVQELRDNGEWLMYKFFGRPESVRAGLNKVLGTIQVGSQAVMIAKNVNLRRAFEDMNFPAGGYAISTERRRYPDLNDAMLEETHVPTLVSLPEMFNVEKKGLLEDLQHPRYADRFNHNSNSNSNYSNFNNNAIYNPKHNTRQRNWMYPLIVRRVEVWKWNTDPYKRKKLRTIGGNGASNRWRTLQLKWRIPAAKGSTNHLETLFNGTRYTRSAARGYKRIIPSLPLPVLQQISNMRIYKRYIRTDMTGAVGAAAIDFKVQEMEANGGWLVYKFLGRSAAETAGPNRVLARMHIGRQDVMAQDRGMHYNFENADFPQGGFAISTMVHNYPAGNRNFYIFQRHESTLPRLRKKFATGIRIILKEFRRPDLSRYNHFHNLQYFPLTLRRVEVWKWDARPYHRKRLRVIGGNAASERWRALAMGWRTPAITASANHLGTLFNGSRVRINAARRRTPVPSVPNAALQQIARRRWLHHIPSLNNRRRV